MLNPYCKRNGLFVRLANKTNLKIDYPECGCMCLHHGNTLFTNTFPYLCKCCNSDSMEPYCHLCKPELNEGDL